jgi:hypothetical protein
MVPDYDAVYDDMVEAFAATHGRAAPFTLTSREQMHAVWQTVGLARAARLGLRDARRRQGADGLGGVSAGAAPLREGPRGKDHPRTGSCDDRAAAPGYGLYESTLHELEHLWPRLSVGGVLIIDDYGHRQGAREATDEFFDALGPAVLLNRIDYTGRVAVKPAV